MTTIHLTKRRVHRRVDISSDRFEDIIAVARMLFEDPKQLVEYCQNEDGFHIAPLSDGAEVLGTTVGWFETPDLAGSLTKAREWVDSLTRGDRHNKAIRLPEQVYTEDPLIDLVGYRLTTQTTVDGQRLVVTINPAWV